MPKIAVLPGDGIGPEIVVEAVKVLRTIGERFGLMMAMGFSPPDLMCGSEENSGSTSRSTRPAMTSG